MLRSLEQVPLDVIQFHGDETAEQCRQIAQYNKRRYKAIQVKPDATDTEIISTIQQYRQAGASAMLTDAWHPELKGGTGHSFDLVAVPETWIFL